MLIIIPSPPQLNSLSCWPSITHFILLPSAGVPAGAARLPCRKVTTRGQPNVITVGGGHRSCFTQLLGHCIQFLYAIYYKNKTHFRLFFYKAVKMLVILLLNFSLNLQSCVFCVISTSTNSLYICERINCSYSYYFKKKGINKIKYQDN